MLQQRLDEKLILPPSPCLCLYALCAFCLCLLYIAPSVISLLLKHKVKKKKHGSLVMCAHGPDASGHEMILVQVSCQT